VFASVTGLEDALSLDFEELLCRGQVCVYPRKDKVYTEALIRPEGGPAEEIAQVRRMAENAPYVFLAVFIFCVAGFVLEEIKKRRT